MLAVSFARLVGDINSAAFDIEVVQTALMDPLWRTRLGINLLLFALAMLALHLAFGLACWLMAWLTRKAFASSRLTQVHWVLIWFLAGAIWVLLANAASFPHSSLGEPHHGIATASFAGMTPHSLAGSCLVAGIAVVLLKLLYQQRKSRRTMYLLAVGVGLAASAGFTWHSAARHRAAEGPPNIFVLGIDSMRPDFVAAGKAPNVHAFMDGAVRMQDAVTPLARTFPSWISILTGRHPHTTGAFMNLLPRKLIHTGTTLPQALREHGYRSYFAIDETRFANIDTTYGFDETMTSTIGGSDFVISWFADTPLSNIVMNTWLGAVLFPHVHANRAAYVTYDPDTFVRRVVGRLDRSRPVFLSTHLTLPHWPYSWATSDAIEPVEANFPQLYENAVHRADKQLGDMLHHLEEQGFLDNAIVVVLSDHGEALGQHSDFMSDFYPNHRDPMPRAQIWGHGTSVFSPTQYRVVLGIRGYGAAASLFPQPAKLDQPTSLLDVAPTIMELLQIKATDQFDGHSLVPLLRTGTDSRGELAQRIRFTETEYNPEGFLPGHMTTSTLAQAAQIYHLDSSSDRLLVREAVLPAMLANRQYAALLGDGTMGIAMPDGRGDGKYAFIHVPNALKLPASPASNAVQLRVALQDRYRIQFADTTLPAAQ